MQNTNINCLYFQLQITVFRCGGDRGGTTSSTSGDGGQVGGRSGDASGDELDQVIMTALFKAQHLSPTEQLSLALTWNRCDIAKKEIFTYGN